MKTRRHAKILELIKAQDIDTQEELLRNLRACGFDVTQGSWNFCDTSDCFPRYQRASARKESFPERKV